MQSKAQGSSKAEQSKVEAKQSTRSKQNKAKHNVEANQSKAQGSSKAEQSKVEAKHFKSIPTYF